MGMFDWVNFEMNCPDCGELITGFQSKDGMCSLAKIDPTEVSVMYSSCDCGRWVELKREPTPAKECREKPYTLEEAESMGFRLID